MFWNRLLGYAWPATVALMILALHYIENTPQGLTAWTAFAALAMFVLAIVLFVWYVNWTAPRPLNTWD